MKKLLIASTALVATAGVAAADIAITGSARMGVQYSNAADLSWLPGIQAWGLEKRFTLNITATGETDGGMGFGAAIRMRDNENRPAAVTTIMPTDSRVWIEMGGFEVAVGNTDGAADLLPGLWANGVGLTGLGWHGVVLNTLTGGLGYFTSWASGLGTNTPGVGPEQVAVTYSTGDLSVRLSSSQMLNGAAALGVRLTALGASYSFGDWAVGAVVQRDNIAGNSPFDLMAATVTGSFGDFGVNLGVSRHSNSLVFVGFPVNKMVLGANYSGGDFGVNAYVSRETAGGGVFAANSVGLGATYNLGGATLAAGVSNIGGGGGINMADFGIRFNF